MKIIPKRETARKESIVGGQGKGDVTCSCKGKCNTNHCSCKKEGRCRNWQSPVPEMGPLTKSPVPVWDLKHNRTGTGRARSQKWEHAHRVRFQYGTLNTTVLELAEPGTGNGTSRTESTFRYGAQ